MEWVPLASVPGLIEYRGDLEFRNAGRVDAVAHARGLGRFGDPPGQLTDTAALAG